jgi:anti-anti-sigma factor
MREAGGRRPVPDIRYRVEMTSGMPVVAAPAAIDFTTKDELRTILHDLAADGHATVVVDMTHTPLCDSGGLSVLVRAHRRAVAKEGGLRLVISADGPVVRALDLTGVGRFIPTFRSTEEALAASPPRPSQDLNGDAHPPGRLAEGT